MRSCAHRVAHRVAHRWLFGRDDGELETRKPDEVSDDSLFERFLAERYQGGEGEVPNPNRDPDAQQSVKFQTAYKDPLFRRDISEQFKRWKGSLERGPTEEPQTRPEVPAERPARQGWGSFKDQDATLDVARHGRMVDEEPIARQSKNVTRKRRLKLQDKERDFIWKPQEGEHADLRYGIQPGTYHQREAASYNIDRLLGEGTVVPPTMTSGTGSYQAWSEGAQTLGAAGSTLDHLSNEDLKRSPSFRRLVTLDAILGHEDRHANNVMFSWTGPEQDPRNLQFDAIDNGLVLASPEEKDTPDKYVVVMPWSRASKDPGGQTGMGRLGAVTDVLSEVDSELHDQLRGIKLEDFIGAITSTGVKDEKAILAAAVRLVTLQEDAFALGEIIRESGGNPRKGVATFLHLSGSDPKKLLGYARAEHRLPEIEKAIKAAI